MVYSKIYKSSHKNQVQREHITKRGGQVNPDINIFGSGWRKKKIADLIDIYLVSDGYKVFKAENAEAGLNILDKQDIHLVLLDIMMPGMNGLEMCRKDPWDK